MAYMNTVHTNMIFVIVQNTEGNRPSDSTSIGLHQVDRFDFSPAKLELHSNFYYGSSNEASGSAGNCKLCSIRCCCKPEKCGFWCVQPFSAQTVDEDKLSDF